MRAASLPPSTANLWRELLSGRWVLGSRSEEDGGVLLVFRRRVGRQKPLSPRQRQALELAAGGRSLKQVAHEMSTSVSTASTHVATALERLGVSRSDAGLLLAACVRRGAATPAVPGVDALLAVRLAVDGFPRSEHLTRAELDVAHALRRGHSNAKIAADRQRSRSTVANQVAAIFRKLGVTSRAEMLANWDRDSSTE